MAILKLFSELLRGEWFHFYENPSLKLIKNDDTHYVSPTGRHQIHPHVLVFGERAENPRKSIYDQTKGDSNEKPDS